MHTLGERCRCGPCDDHGDNGLLNSASISLNICPPSLTDGTSDDVQSCSTINPQRYCVIG